MVHKLFEVVNVIFLLEWEIQQWLMRNFPKQKYQLEKVLPIIDLTYLLLFYVILQIKIDVEITMRILLFLSIICACLHFCSKSLITFTTVSGFLTTGIFVTIFIFLLSLYFLGSVIGFDFLLDRSNSYWMILLLLIVIWSFVSTLCNAKVSTLSNAILSVFIGIAMQINSFVKSISVLDVGNVLLSNPIIRLISLGNFQLEIILFPVFIVLAVGTISCAAKGYWINKYNGGRDIEARNN